LLRVQPVDGGPGASRETQETGECDGEQRRQEPSHPAPPFTRDREYGTHRGGFSDFTPEQLHVQ
jgi:hypothetical protein